jgi:hypothetical protein
MSLLETFTIHLLRRDGSVWARWLSAFGPNEVSVTLPKPEPAPSSREERRHLGTQLFAAVFSEGSALRSELATYLQRAHKQQFDPLIRLLFDEQTAPEALCPWELLRDGDRYLLLDGIEIVRSFTTQRCPTTPTGLPLCVLGLAAASLATEDALAAIREVAELSVRIAPLASETLNRISELHAGPPSHVLHIAGQSAAGDAGQLVIHSAEGQRFLLALEPSDFVTPPVALAVASSSDDAAWALLQAGAASVVIVQGVLSDNASTPFFTTLYRSLMAGEGLRSAVAAARKQLLPFEEWHKPALYLASEDVAGPLFTSWCPAFEEESPLVPSVIDFAAVPHERLYSVMQSAFPSGGDIDDICFRFGIRYHDDLEGARRTDKIRDLIRRLHAGGQYADLVRTVIRERPYLQERLLSPLPDDAAHEAAWDDQVRDTPERLSVPRQATDSLPEPADLHIRLKEAVGAIEAEMRFRLPDSADDKEWTRGAPRIILNETVLREHSGSPERYGDALTKMFFADERLTKVWSKARDQAFGLGVPLRIRLELAEPIRHVRWELLRTPTPSDSRFICTDQRIRFSRYLASATDASLRLRERIGATALVAVAAPADLENIGFAAINKEQEHNLIRPALEELRVTYLAQTSLASLVCNLQDNPAVLYLLCHGGESTAGPYLVLEDDDGNAEEIPVQKLIEAIGNLAAPPLLVVLASCKSAGTSSDPQSTQLALGPKLAEAGVGAVVAMPDNIAMETLQQGMPVFFRRLLRHGHVDAAMAEMRSVLMTKEQDWWQPVLFLRLREGKLFR